MKYINNEGERNLSVYIVDKPRRHYVKQEDTRNRKSSTVQFHWYTESDFFFSLYNFVSSMKMARDWSRVGQNRRLERC